MARVSIQKNIAFDDERNIYYVTMDFGKDENGRRVKSTKTYKNKKDAVRALKLFEADKIKQLTVMPKKITVGEWLEYWMENVIELKNARTTCYGYEQIIKNHIKPYIGNMALQEVKATDIQRYMKNIQEEKNLSAVTVRKHYALLKTAFSFAVKQEYLSKNIIDMVEPPKAEHREMAVYNVEQIEKLLKCSEGEKMEIVIALATYLGLRRGEYSGLKWENVDMENRCITIKETRTSAGSEIVNKGTKNESSTRKLNIPDVLYEVLLKEQQRQREDKAFFGKAYEDSGYVITNDIGAPVRPNRLSEQFKIFIEENDLPPITLHGLRHSFASNANQLGVSLYDISKALGHSNTSTTSSVYMHTFEKAQTYVVNKVADLYAGKEKGTGKSISGK